MDRIIVVGFDQLHQNLQKNGLKFKISTLKEYARENKIKFFKNKENKFCFNLKDVIDVLNLKYSKNCVKCNKVFESKYKFQKFCSISCKAKIARINHRIKIKKIDVLNDKIIPLNKFCVLQLNTCNFCKKQWLSNKRKRICSESCKKKLYDLVNIKKIGHKKQYPVKYCINCNNTFKANSKYCEKCRLHNYVKNKKVSQYNYIKLKFSKKTNYIINRKVHDKFDWECQICGTKVQNTNINAPDAAQVDHIVPISKGGTHTWDNVQTLCRMCNVKKSNKITNNLQPCHTN